MARSVWTRRPGAGLNFGIEDEQVDQFPGLVVNWIHGAADNTLNDMFFDSGRDKIHFRSARIREAGIHAAVHQGSNQGLCAIHVGHDCFFQQRESERECDVWKRQKILSQELSRNHISLEFA